MRPSKGGWGTPHAGGPTGSTGLEQGWDALSQVQRVESATREFEQALSYLEVEHKSADALLRARRALTLLRPELSRTRRGIDRHAELERRFEALAE
ncbi:hypothetical protein [Enhygromyxa salina]|uniref:hypothetical protein n=1 Tax=Enhygromyxa salina TaxID=215803 RepID=UPI0011B20096|nr:hypothetical protein [Enhygromyxa salina]